jgi:hypothetical protein
MMASALAPVGDSVVGCPTEVDQICYDENHMIVDRSCNGGDTAQREGMYWFGQWVRQHAPELRPGRLYGSPRPIAFSSFGRPNVIGVMDLLEEKDRTGRPTGRFRRHPTQTRWNDPNEMSRDNVFPLIAALGVMGDYDRLTRLVDHIQKKVWIFNVKILNQDYLDAFNAYIARARNDDPNSFLDHLELDLAVASRFANIKDMDDVGDDLNLTTHLLLALVRYRKNHVAAICDKFANKRPPGKHNYGVYLTSYRERFKNDPAKNNEDMKGRLDEGIKSGTLKADVNDLHGAFKWYFRPEAHACPGLAALYEPILDAFFAGPPPASA